MIKTSNNNHNHEVTLENFNQESYDNSLSRVTPKRAAVGVFNSWIGGNKQRRQNPLELIKNTNNKLELTNQDIINLIQNYKINTISTVGQNDVVRGKNANSEDTNNMNKTPNSPKLIKNQRHKQELLRLHNDTLITSLNELYSNMYCSKESKKKTGKAGKLDNKKFIHKLQHEFDIFDNCYQHDAHELLQHLLNSLHESVGNELIIRNVFESKMREEFRSKLEDSVMQDSYCSSNLSSNFTNFTNANGQHGQNNHFEKEPTSNQSDTGYSSTSGRLGLNQSNSHFSSANVSVNDQLNQSQKSKKQKKLRLHLFPSSMFSKLKFKNKEEKLKDRQQRGKAGAASSLTRSAQSNNSSNSNQSTNANTSNQNKNKDAGCDLNTINLTQNNTTDVPGVLPGVSPSGLPRVPPTNLSNNDLQKSSTKTSLKSSSQTSQKNEESDVYKNSTLPSNFKHLSVSGGGYCDRENSNLSKSSNLNSSVELGVGFWGFVIFYSLVLVSFYYTCQKKNSALLFQTNTANLQIEYQRFLLISDTT